MVLEPIPGGFDPTGYLEVRMTHDEQRFPGASTTTDLRAVTSQPTSRRNFLKWSAVGAGTIALGPALAACGGDSGSSSGGSSAVGKIVQLQQGEIETVPARAQTFKDFAAKFPKITIDRRVLPSGSEWDQQARTSIQSGEDVDLLSINGQFIRAWQRDGLLEDLSEVSDLQDTLSRVDSGSLGASSVDGKSYAVPLGQSGGQHTTVFYYNKKLLDQVGLAAPTSIADLKAMVAPLRAVGASPLVHPAGDVFQNPLLVMWILPLVLGSTDPIKFVTDTQRGDVKYTSSEWVSAFEVIADLTDSGVMLPGAASVAPDAVTQYLSTAKAACLYNGTWMIPAMEASAKFEPHITKLPILDAGSTAKTIAAYLAYGIPKVSKRKGAVVSYLNYAGSAEVDRRVTKETQQFSPILESNAEISGGLPQEALPLFEDTIAPLDWLWEPEITSEVGNQVQGLVKGSVSPADAAKKLENTMESLRSSGRAFYN